jgi:outer membrane biogenesis lipoprotein LolB
MNSRLHLLLASCLLAGCSSTKQDVAWDIQLWDENEEWIDARADYYQHDALNKIKDRAEAENAAWHDAMMGKDFAPDR